MSSFTIRRLVAADASSFKYVRLKGLAEHPDAFTSTVEDWDQPLDKFVERIVSAHMIGGFDAKGTLLGHVLLATHFATGVKTKHKCEIWSVYALPEARGTGLARAMLEEAIRIGRDLGYAWLKLQVGEHNAPARRLYESLGFTVYGREEDYLRLPDGRSITELMMQKRL
jgi:ribosomal protein S18 acetylase RimI-like enzyme